MVLFKSILLAFIFIISGGELFKNFSEKHKALAIPAYMILVASGIFVLRELYNEFLYFVENIYNLSFFYWIKLLIAGAICIFAPIVALLKTSEISSAANSEARTKPDTSPDLRGSKNQSIPRRLLAFTFNVTRWIESFRRFSARAIFDEIRRSLPVILIMTIIAAEIYYANRLFNKENGLFSLDWSKWNSDKEKKFPAVTYLGCTSFLNYATVIIKSSRGVNRSEMQNQFELMKNIARRTPSNCSGSLVGGAIKAVVFCRSGSIRVEIGTGGDENFLLSTNTDRSGDVRPPAVGEWLLGLSDGEEICQIGESGVPVRAKRLSAASISR